MKVVYIIVAQFRKSTDSSHLLVSGTVIDPAL